MPTYDYKCSACESVREAFVHVDNRNQPLTCKCGGQMNRIATAPMIDPIILGGGTYQGYKCPITDRYVTSRKDRNNIMAEHDVVEKD